MKIYLSGILTLLILSCQSPNRNTDEINFATVDEFQTENKRSDAIGYSWRKSGDIISHLFNEAKEKDPKLMNLSNAIKEMDSMQRDSLQAINDYLRYNSIYASSLEGHINSIQDSTKRKTLKEMLSLSEVEYDKNLKGHREKMDRTNNLAITLKDQFIMMKLIIVADLMSKYQKNIPSDNSIDHLNEIYETLINETNSYVDNIK